MADKHQQQHQMATTGMTTKTVILTSVAATIIAGPLIGIMGFTFLATTALLVVTFPLFILFSPLLFGAAFILTLTLVGFAAAATMAVVGVTLVARVARALTEGRRGVLEGLGGEKFVKEGKDWGGGFLEQKGHNPHDVNVVMRG